jgi:NADH-quinone oxidoreductase subunit M
MNLLLLPVAWLEIAVALSLVGALCVSLLREPFAAWRWGLVFAGAVFACACATCLAFYAHFFQGTATEDGFLSTLTGWNCFYIDELNAPLLPLVALIHFLTALATGRTKMRRFSLSWSLVSDALRLAIFGCAAEWPLVVLLSVCVLPPYIELRNRHKPTRVYVLHMAAFVGLLLLGWMLLQQADGDPTHIAWASLPLLLAVLIRCGAAPAHCWITDWFEHASFGNALLFVMPLAGVYAAIRIVLPIAPDAMLQWIGYLSLFTAIYAAGMSAVQRETRRFFAYLFLSHASLVLVGLELHTAISLTGALALWISASLSLAGFGLTLRALEARYGRLSLVKFHGLYNQSPMLAICFLLTGLGSVGFPGTLGFVGADLLVDEAVKANLYIGLIVALTAALNGIAVVRAYFHLFTGARHVSTVSLHVNARERFAVLLLAALIIGGGLFPQFGVAALNHAAVAILAQRKTTATESPHARSDAKLRIATHDNLRAND